MRLFLIISVTTILLASCTKDSKTFNNQKYSFAYPSSWEVIEKVDTDGDSVIAVKHATEENHSVIFISEYDGILDSSQFSTTYHESIGYMNEWKNVIFFQESKEYMNGRLYNKMGYSFKTLNKEALGEVYHTIHNGKSYSIVMSILLDKTLNTDSILLTSFKKTFIIK